MMEIGNQIKMNQKQDWLKIEFNCHNNKQNKILCLAMDRNRSGTIDFDEFLVSIRVKELIIKLGITNQKSYCRLSIYQVRQNREMEGQLLMILSKQIMKYKMRSVQYKVSSQSQMTENQVLDEFLVNFGDVDKNGQLTYEEWIDDYAAVLASVDNDEHFVLLMKMAWKI
ncbi:unnamed protein product [Paramecium sonneborni]|uniref:EF-hand domain-containing protein n=1 Tax=Paramecium sonneborni TaxID=65129 RepID=A0A8S1JXP0_9CILI|nr:unnamed protein product [Paramecium sonneborni]